MFLIVGSVVASCNMKRLQHILEICSHAVMPAACLLLGDEWRGLPPRRATIRVIKMDMFRKVVQRTDVGLGEAYMDGDYMVDDVAALMALMVANARNLEGQKGLLGVANWINDKMLVAAHARRSNTRQGEVGWTCFGRLGLRVSGKSTLFLVSRPKRK